MAATRDAAPDQQFQCSICQQVFCDPVTTPCGHNFCQSCLRRLWDGSPLCRCPVCQRSFPSRPEVSVNTAFKELADAFRRTVVSTSAPPLAAEAGQVLCDVCAAASLQVAAHKSCLVCMTSYCGGHLEPHRRVATLQMHRLIGPVGDLQQRLCEKHDRLLEMFCRDQQTCVCQFCAETEHKDHDVVRLEDECEDRKVQMEKTEADFQQMVQERLNKVEEIKRCLDLSNKSAATETEKNHQLFSSLMRSVEERRDEVDGEIEELRKAAAARAGELTAELQQEITALQTRMTELGELRSSEDHLHVLQRLPSLTALPPARAWGETGVHPELCVGTLRHAVSKLDVTLRAQLEDLKKEEMSRMQQYAVEVELDPHTAHPNIVLSADGKRAGRGELLHLVPDNPQRFDPVICVMAKRGFQSGRFYFQVEVGDKTFWDLGVVKESVNRKGMITSKPENGFWTVRLRGGSEYRALDSPSVLLAVEGRPRTVGVFVDYEAGSVSFFHVEAAAHLYTFHGGAFSERLFPFLSPGVNDEGRNQAPLVIADVSQG